MTVRSVRPAGGGRRESTSARAEEACVKCGAPQIRIHRDIIRLKRDTKFADGDSSLLLVPRSVL